MKIFAIRSILVNSAVICAMFFSRMAPAKNLFLPVPRNIVYSEGRFVPAPGGLIHLDAKVDDQILSIGLDIQQCLRMLGRNCQITAACGNPGLIAVSASIDPSAVDRPQGYRLTIEPAQITVKGTDTAGLYYAVRTLAQLCHQSLDGTLPCLEITDYPDMLNRGVMLDISRDKVPTMQTLYQIIDTLASWKINQLQLYTEHTFAYPGHEAVWKDASPMTAQQILELDSYCRKRFIQLVANQNSFGHMSRWLSREPYAHLAESHERYALCPTDPNTIAFLEELYDRLLPNFSSRLFNVGCDEVYTLGRGRSGDACDRLGIGNVYLDFLLKVHRLCRDRGRTMQFWADMVLQYPELISRLPGDAVAMIWGYEASHPFGTDAARFAVANKAFYVCPGTSSWNALAGRTDNAVENLRNAAESGIKYGAGGYLVTDWGDRGHWQPLPVSYLGFAYGAAVSWACRENSRIDLPAVLNSLVFRDSAAVIGTVAFELGNLYQMPGTLVPNSSVLVRLLYEPGRNLSEIPYNTLTAEGLKQTSVAIDRIIAPLENARMQRPDAKLIKDEFRFAADMLGHACNLGIARLQAEGQELANISPAVARSLAEELRPLIAEHGRIWLLRNRPGGLADSKAGLDRILESYQSLAPPPQGPSEVESGEADLVVAQDGSGHFKTISAAVDSLPMYTYRRTVILIEEGTYREKLRIEPHYVTLRGWCFARDCSFYSVRKASVLWHAGGYDRDQKFVLRNCTFDGEQPYLLGAHHYDAQFYLLDCRFSKDLLDKPIFYVAQDDPARNNPCLWGQRKYFYNCHRDSGDYDWFGDNPDQAEGSPRPGDITPVWTFGGAWDPESTAAPRITKIGISGDKVLVTFNEIVTFRSRVVLRTDTGKSLTAVPRRFTDIPTFEFVSDEPLAEKDLRGPFTLEQGAIAASQASVNQRQVGKIIALP